MIGNRKPSFAPTMHLTIEWHVGGEPMTDTVHTHITVEAVEAQAFTKVMAEPAAQTKVISK